MIKLVKLFFQQNGNTKFVDISPETHERLRLHSWKVRVSLQQVVNAVHEKFGDVSEELIVRYLDEFSQ